MEHLEEIPPEFVGETELPVDPDSLTSAELLFAESQISLNHWLGRNVIDGILDHIQGPIAKQSSYFGYDPRFWSCSSHVGFFRLISQATHLTLMATGANSSNYLMNWGI
jgi:hypothetical protein